MIFIDTGAFVARYLERDQYHEQAVAHWEHLKQERLRCFTSNHVLDETFTILGRRATYQFAAARAEKLLQAKALHILRSDHEDERAAVELFEKFADQEVSFTDCLSFILMKKHGLIRVFTFDRHFQDAGFSTEPSVL